MSRHGILDRVALIKDDRMEPNLTRQLEGRLHLGLGNPSRRLTRISLLHLGIVGIGIFIVKPPLT